MRMDQLSRKNNGSSLLRSLLLFKLLELMVVVLVLSVLYSVMISKILAYRQDFEVAEVNWTVAMMRTAKRAQLTQQEFDRALGRPGLQAENGMPVNPVLLLHRQPRNYVGELCNPDERELGKGIWYFDKCNLWLVYIFADEKFFPQEHPKLLKFHVESLRLLTEPA